MTNEEIARFFNDTRAFIQGNPDLRDPQVEGWFRTRQHFRNSSEHAILQIPVGCGKTGLMALLPFEIAQGRVLVIAPNLEIRRGISTAFDVAAALDHNTLLKTVYEKYPAYARESRLRMGLSSKERPRGRMVKMDMRDTAIHVLQQAGESQKEPARP